MNNDHLDQQYRILTVEIQESEDEVKLVQSFMFNLSTGEKSQITRTLDNFKVDFSPKFTILINNDLKTQEHFLEFFFLKHDGFFPSTFNTFYDSVQRTRSIVETNFNWKTVETGSIVIARVENNQVVMHDQNRNAALRFNRENLWGSVPPKSCLIISTDLTFKDLLLGTVVLPGIFFHMKMSQLEMENLLTVYLPHNNYVWEKPPAVVLKQQSIWISSQLLRTVLNICQKFETTEYEELLERSNSFKSIEYWVDPQSLEIRNDNIKKPVSTLIVENVLDKAIKKIMDNPLKQTPKSVLNLIFQHISSTRGLLLTVAYSTNMLNEGDARWLFNKPQFKSSAKVYIILPTKKIEVRKHRGSLALSKTAAEQIVAQLIINDMENLLSETSVLMAKNTILDSIHTHSDDSVNYL